MTDIQAALLSIRRIEQFVTIAQRHEIAERYNTLLEGLPVSPPWQRTPREIPVCTFM